VGALLERLKNQQVRLLPRQLLKLYFEAHAGLGLHHLLPWPYFGPSVAEVHDRLIWWKLHPQMRKQLPTNKNQHDFTLRTRKNERIDSSRT
jgi:hypothetical protein